MPGCFSPRFGGERLPVRCSPEPQLGVVIYFSGFGYVMSGNRCLRVFAALALCASTCLSSSDEEKTLLITSEPSGAHIILNGRDRGKTPFEMKVGHWAFEVKKPTAFSKHLLEPWILQISKDGYRTEKIELTRGPFTWQSMNGRNTYQYWVLNSPSYNVKLRPATRVLTNADVLQLLKTGIGDALIIEKIQTSSCEFKTDPEDIVALHTSGVSDAIIAAMMRAVPVEQSGPATGIQPVKK